MPTLSTSLYKFIIAVGVFLLFIPKINLISIQKDESAGIRIDDILLGIIIGVLFFGFLIVKRKTITKLEFSFGLLILIFLFSNLINFFLKNQSNLLYTFRYIEYFIFFYIGYYYSLKYSLKKLLLWILIINGLIMFLQIFNIIGGFASAGYANTSSDRAIGLTGGPWEIGAIINFIFAIFLFDKNGFSAFKINILFFVTFILVAITGARMPALAHLVLFFIYKYSKTKYKFLFTAVLIINIIIFAFLFLIIPNPIKDRSLNLFSIENFNQFINVYKEISISGRFYGFPDLTDFSTSGDMSWLFRVSKWAYAIKRFLGINYAWFIGLGPGIWGLALDGGWVRLITESGIIGTSMFIMFFKRASKINKAVYGIVLSLFINMLMIDIYISYKAMALVFFIIGYYYQKMEYQKKIKLIFFDVKINVTE